MAVNIPQGWVTDQALVPEDPVDLYDQDRPFYTVAWPQGHAPTGGAVIAVVWTDGSNYPDGSYTGVATTGGHGTGAVMSITVANGAVTSGTVTSVGSGYKWNDKLNIGQLGGAGEGMQFVVVGTSA